MSDVSRESSAGFHQIKFQRNADTGQWRGVCSCGQQKVGTAETVTTWGALHDLNCEPVEHEGSDARA